MSESQQKKKVELDPTLDFIAGTIAGSAAITVGYPFDTVKVRFQNPAVSARYASTFPALATIIRQEGPRSLYKGVSSPLFTAAPLNGVVFASYRFFMKSQINEDNSDPTLAQITLAGAGSGMVASVITTPMELVKIHQQSLISTPGSKPIPTSQVALRIFRQHGLKGLYRGMTATGFRDLGYGSYFAAYEATLRFFPPSYPDPHDQTSLSAIAESEVATHSWGTLLLAGGLAGVAGWLATFPFDVVKTRVQSSFDTSLENPYRNTWSTIVTSYKDEGIRVFFRGLAPTLIRAVPVNMVTFGTFEAIVHAFS